MTERDKDNKYKIKNEYTWKQKGCKLLDGINNEGQSEDEYDSEDSERYLEDKVY